MSNIIKSLACFSLSAGLLVSATNSTFAQQTTTSDNPVAVITAKRVEAPKSIVVVDELARFPGCEEGQLTVDQRVQCAETAMQKFIGEHLKYPSSAQSDDFKPRIVRVEITVEPDGRIHSPRIPEPGIKEYDQNAQAVFVEMAQKGLRWTPAKVEGQSIRTPAIATIHFDWKGRNKAFSAQPLGDDTYRLVDEVPSFQTCQNPGMKDDQILDCAMQQMDDFFQRFMQYPAEALTLGLEGDISVQFVVGKDGSVRDVRLKNDLGLGTGDEVRRLFNLMNEKTIGWIAGEEDGQKVNVALETVVHFKLKPTQKPAGKLASMDAKSVFVTERPGYEEFEKSFLKYPKGEGINPCRTGVVDVQFKVNPQTEGIEITNMLDYNNLGKEYKDAATAFIAETQGEWNVKYANLSPETKFFLSLPFSPAGETCPDVPKGYKEMIDKAAAGATLAEKKATLMDGLELLDKAVRMYPADNKIRYLRGMALYNQGRQVEGCVDLSFVNKENKDIVVPKTCK